MLLFTKEDRGTTVAPSDESGEQATNENDDSSDEKSEEDT